MVSLLSGRAEPDGPVETSTPRSTSLTTTMRQLMLRKQLNPLREQSRSLRARGFWQMLEQALGNHCEAVENWRRSMLMDLDNLGMHICFSFGDLSMARDVKGWFGCKALLICHFTAFSCFISILIFHSFLFSNLTLSFKSYKSNVVDMNRYAFLVHW